MYVQNKSTGYDIAVRTRTHMHTHVCVRGWVCGSAAQFNEKSLQYLFITVLASRHARSKERAISRILPYLPLCPLREFY